MTDLKSVEQNCSCGFESRSGYNQTKQTTMRIFDYPEFIEYHLYPYIRRQKMVLLITVDHPVIKYFGVTEDGYAVLFNNEETELYKIMLLREKCRHNEKAETGDVWAKEKPFWGENSVIERWQDLIDNLYRYKQAIRHETAAVVIYQKIKHEYEMEKLTQEFSNFRKSFDEKLDRIIDTITKKPSKPTTTSTVEKVVEKKLEPKPKLELKNKPKRTSPAFTAETIWKSCKNIGIAKTAVKFEITEDEVRKLKKEYKK